MELSTKEYVGLGKVPVGIGAMMKGWGISEEHYRDINKFTIVNFRAMTEACPHDCFHCFTDKTKRSLSLEEIKMIIDKLAAVGTSAIDYVGEGEPTIDPYFFDIINYTKKKGIQPVVYTDAATMLRDKDFVKRLYNTGASVAPKCDSLFNEEYQNWLVGDKKGVFFKERNEAISLLMDCGFNQVNDDATTRLGFDMVLSTRNMHEVDQTLRFCRENNIWIIFSYFLPTGRSGMEEFDRTLVIKEEDKVIIRNIIKSIDAEYGFQHRVWNNLGTTRCIEFFHILGNGDVTACVANDDVVGNIVEKDPLELQEVILKKYPFHDRRTHDGHCTYKPKID